jgi:hydrogenase maturation factor
MAFRISDTLDVVEHLDDDDMAKVAWSVIRALADRGAPLAKAIEAMHDDDAGGMAWHLEEAVAQLEDIHITDTSRPVRGEINPLGGI